MRLLLQLQVMLTPHPGMSFSHGAPAVVLFTGSRMWVDQWTIKDTLDEIVVRAHAAAVPELTFRHGACYPFEKWNPAVRRKVRPHRSVDYFVHLWIARFGADQPITIREQERPADWEAPCRASCQQRYHRNNPINHRVIRGGRLICPAAGNYRNRAMVLEDPRPHFGVAFHQDNSNGTADCIKTARELSVPMYVIDPKVLP